MPPDMDSYSYLMGPFRLPDANCLTIGSSVWSNSSVDPSHTTLPWITKRFSIQTVNSLNPTTWHTRHHMSLIEVTCFGYFAYFPEYCQDHFLGIVDSPELYLCFVVISVQCCTPRHLLREKNSGRLRNLRKTKDAAPHGGRSGGRPSA